MKYPIIAAAILLSILLNTTNVAVAGEAIEIAIPGQFHDADEVKSGDGWWGLYREGTFVQFKMEPISITMAAVYSRDQRRTEAPSDVEIAISPRLRQPEVILRGIEGLRAGPVKALYWNYGRGEFLNPGEGIAFTDEHQDFEVHYSVRAVGTTEEPADKAKIRSRNYGWVLERKSNVGSRRQTLLSITELGVDSFPQILWVGDLDRDGLPDLIVDERPSEFKLHIVLYLSSKAGAGELVGRVAEWGAQEGC